MITPSQGENRGSGPLGSASKFKWLVFEDLTVSRLCPVKIPARERRLVTASDGGGPHQAKRARAPVGHIELRASERSLFLQFFSKCDL
jgi:hypothetical protein